MPSGKKQGIWQAFGPGILFASTAIGVSHLVQSTRAGADYGFALAGFVIAANVFKYPFFEFGSRYANATGESIIDGYARIGRWMLWLYAAITLVSMFFVSSAVGAVTGGFLQNLFGIPGSPLWVNAGLFALCAAILMAGRYSALDMLIKVIGSVLLVSTVAAFALAVARGPAERMEGFAAPDVWDAAGIGFLIALMGWMPTAVDLSAWNSLWTIERMRQTGYRPPLRQTLLDFNIGYAVSAVLALCFVTLGAYMLYGTGKALPDGSAAFAHAVVGLYTEYIGQWGHILIAASAFSIMFGTCIAVFDGFARSAERTAGLLLIGSAKGGGAPTVYRITLAIVALGAYAIILLFPGSIKALVDLATTVSFLVAPVIAIVNLRLVTRKAFPQEARPAPWLLWLARAGVVFLTGFAVLFAYARLVGG